MSGYLVLVLRTLGSAEETFVSPHPPKVPTLCLSSSSHYRRLLSLLSTSQSSSTSLSWRICAFLFDLRLLFCRLDFCTPSIGNLCLFLPRPQTTPSFSSSSSSRTHRSKAHTTAWPLLFYFYSLLLSPQVVFPFHLLLLFPHAQPCRAILPSRVPRSSNLGLASPPLPACCLRARSSPFVYANSRFFHLQTLAFVLGLSLACSCQSLEPTNLALLLQPAETSVHIATLVLLYKYDWLVGHTPV